MKVTFSNSSDKVYNIGSGIGNSINQIINLLSSVLRISPLLDYVSSRECDPKSIVLDISRIKRVIDWKPKISMEEGIMRTYKYITNERVLKSSPN